MRLDTLTLIFSFLQFLVVIGALIKGHLIVAALFIISNIWLSIFVTYLSENPIKQTRRKK